MTRTYCLEGNSIMPSGGLILARVIEIFKIKIKLKPSHSLLQGILCRNTSEPSLQQVAFDVYFYIQGTLDSECLVIYILTSVGSENAKLGKSLRCKSEYFYPLSFRLSQRSPREDSYHLAPSGTYSTCDAPHSWPFR